MGYDLRITRAIDWTENLGLQIAAEEWLAVARADVELDLDPAHGPYAVRYRTTAWFDWFEGNVFTTDPDRSTVAKMLAIARVLDGIVQGDGGEIYENPLQWPNKRPGSGTPR
jgi:hypothetical protein